MDKEIDGLPWITYKAQNKLDSLVNERLSVFEWGCGGSSVYFANRVKKIITIEHNREWLNKVTNQVNHNNWEGYCYPPEKLKDEYSSTDAKFTGYSFKNYVKAIDIYRDNIFDIIMIDGRARTQCITKNWQVF